MSRLEFALRTMKLPSSGSEIAELRTLLPRDPSVIAKDNGTYLRDRLPTDPIDGFFLGSGGDALTKSLKLPCEGLHDAFDRLRRVLEPIQ